MPNSAEIRFRAKTIVTSLPCDIYSDHPKENTVIKFSLSEIHMSLPFYVIQIDLFKYKTFKDGRCSYKNTE